MMSHVDVTAVKGFFAGSGMRAFAEAAVVDRVLQLTGRFDMENKVLTAPVRVTYIGTATYDIPKYKDEQTKWFKSRGCIVGEVRVANISRSTAIDKDELEFLGQTHIVLVSGGNTLFAVRRWEETGLDTCLRALAVCGVVLAGGSAGAICWFSSGHSDSADPSTYAVPMLRAAAKENGDKEGNGENANEGGEAAVEKGAHENGQQGKGGGGDTWAYIRVHGLGILPGLLCPHYDVCQSNGVLREEDFDKMMKRHPTERGIGIDNSAALVLPGDGTYEVFQVPRKERRASNTTAPGIYVKDVLNGKVVTKAVPEKGDLCELLREPSGPLVRDPFEAYFAFANPTANTEKLLCQP